MNSKLRSGVFATLLLAASVHCMPFTAFPVASDKGFPLPETEGTVSTRSLRVKNFQHTPKAPATAIRPGAAPANITIAGSPIYGYLIYSDNADQSAGGLYSIDQTDQPRQLWTDEMAAHGYTFYAGWTADNALCGLAKLEYNNKIYAYCYAEADMETGEMIRLEEIDLNQGMQFYFINATYNPDDGYVYGFNVREDRTGYAFSRFKAGEFYNVEKLTDVSSSELCMSMAYDPVQRQIIGAARNGYVVGIDLSSGRQTPLFIPGVDAAPYLSGLVYDPSVDRFLWNAISLSGASSLYQFTLDGNMEKIADYTAQQEFSCFVSTDAYDVDPKAPARPTVKEIKFKDSAYTGTIEYFLPSHLEDGTQFIGTVEWKAYIDGKPVDSGTCDAGSYQVGNYNKRDTQKVVFEGLSSGMHRFSFTVTRDGKESAPCAVMKWIGHDNPLPVKNLLMQDDGSRATFVWDAYEAKGEHGGYVNPDNVMYKVYLNDKLLDSFDQLVTKGNTANNIYTYPSENNGYGDFFPYRFKVVVNIDGYDSKPAYSNIICHGEPWKKAPLTITPTQEEADHCTFWFEKDAEGNVLPSSWRYEAGGQLLLCDQSSAAEKTSWVVLPRLFYPLEDNDGRTVYEVSMDVAAAYVLNQQTCEPIYLDSGSLGIYCNRGVTPTTSANKALEDGIRIKGGEVKTIKAYITRDKIGPNTGKGFATFWLSLKAHSDKGEHFVPVVRNIRIEKTDINYYGLDKVTVTEAPVAAPRGVNEATLKLKLPTKCINGSPLDTKPSTDWNGNIIPGYADSLMNVTVSCAETITIQGKPGSEHEVKIRTNQGKNIIRIQADMTFWERITGSGADQCGYVNYKGLPTEAEVSTGLGIPGPVRNLRSEVGADNRDIALSWERPDELNTGGEFIDPETLTYDVWQYVAATQQQPAHYQRVEADIDNKGLTARLRSGGELDAYNFIVTGSNVAGRATKSPVATVQAGTPMPADMDEDFAGAVPHYWPIGIYTPSEEYAYSYISAGDPASLHFSLGNESGLSILSYVKMPGTKSRVFFPKFSTKGLVAAKFTVRLLNGFIYNSGLRLEPDTIRILAYAHGLKEPVELRCITPGEDVRANWRDYSVEIPAGLMDKEWIELYIDGTFGSTSQFLVFDRYAVESTAGIVMVGEAGRMLYSAPGAIIAQGFNGEAITVCTLDGRVIVDKRAGSDRVAVPVDKGLYVVRAGDMSRKIVVR